MANLLNINNRAQINHLLLTLSANTAPLWGEMTPQQMVEHLVVNVEYTSGKKITTCTRPVEDTYKDKQIWIYTDVQIPKNIILGKLPERLRCDDLMAAVRQLI